MMKTTKKLCLTSVAAMSVGVMLPLCAQTTQDLNRGVNTPTLQTGHVDADHLHTTAGETPISKVNKASGLLGMDVRNAQNEKLGEIKDLVVDLHSGKIAYAVLSVGGFLGIGDKYVAVPPSAFSAAPDQDRLVLNADKAKIQNAPSFAKTSWPDLNSPAWTTESSYWLSDGTAQGTVGASRTGTATESVTPPGRTSERFSTTERRERTGPNDLTSDQRDMFRGKIIAINPEAGTMTVEGPAGTRDFKFNDRPNLTLKENRNPRLTDFKVGYPVVVGYHESNGSYVAHSLMRTDTPEVK